MSLNDQFTSFLATNKQLIANVLRDRQKLVASEPDLQTELDKAPGELNAIMTLVNAKDPEFIK